MSENILEVWKPVVGWETTHQVSSSGRVKRLAGPITNKVGTTRFFTERILRGFSQQSGHMAVKLWATGRMARVLVHRLVLEAFVGPCPKGMQACHFPDRNPRNNRLDNLRWDTAKANQADSFHHGTKACGERQGSSKLTDKAVQDIRNNCRPLRGTRGSLKPSSPKIFATKYGVSIRTVLSIANNRSWRHVT